MKRKYFILQIQGESLPIAIIHTEPPFATNGNDKLPKAYLKFVKETCELKTSLAISEHFNGLCKNFVIEPSKDDCIYNGSFTIEINDECDEFNHTFALISTHLY